MWLWVSDVDSCDGCLVKVRGLTAYCVGVQAVELGSARVCDAIGS